MRGGSGSAPIWGSDEGALVMAAMRAWLAAGPFQGSYRTAIDLPADSGLRDSWVLRALRVCAFLVAVGAVTSPPLANIAAGLCLIFFAALPDLKARVTALRGQPMIRALGVLALVLVASSVYAVLLGSGWRAAAHGLVGWRHLLLVLVIAAAFAEVAPRRRFVMGFVAFGALSAAALVLVPQLGLPVPRLDPHSALLFRNTVTQALLLALGGFLALLAALSPITQGLREKFVLLTGAVVIGGLLVVFQPGRSGLIALIVMVICGIALTFKWRTAIALGVAVIALAGVAVMFSPVQKERFQRAVHELANRDQTAASTSMGIRTLLWRDTAQMIRERPLLGWGLGRYEAAHTALIARGPGHAATPQPGSDPHNQFLRFWVETGVPGLLAFLALLWAAWRQRGPRPYREAGLAILAAWCVNSLFSSHFSNFNEGHLIVVMMGVLLARAPAASPIETAGDGTESVAGASVAQPASPPSAQSTDASTAS